MTEIEKTPLAFTMYKNKLSTTDTIYNNEKRNAYRVLVGDTWRERGHLEDLDVDRNIILKLTIKQYVEGCDLDSSGWEQG